MDCRARRMVAVLLLALFNPEKPPFVMCAQRGRALIAACEKKCRGTKPLDE
jgi:hypothetical protein